MRAPAVDPCPDQGSQADEEPEQNLGPIARGKEVGVAVQPGALGEAVELALHAGPRGPGHHGGKFENKTDFQAHVMQCGMRSAS